MKRLFLVLTIASLLFLALAEDGQTPFAAENRYYLIPQIRSGKDTVRAKGTGTTCCMEMSCALFSRAAGSGQKA